MKQFSPGEHFAAQDKFEQHQKGREEAQKYRELIHILRKRVSQALVKAGCDLRDLPMTGEISKLGDIGSEMPRYVEEAKDPNKTYTKIDVEALLKMSAADFMRYLDTLEASLIK